MDKIKALINYIDIINSILDASDLNEVHDLVVNNTDLLEDLIEELELIKLELIIDDEDI